MVKTLFPVMCPKKIGNKIKKSGKRGITNKKSAFSKFKSKPGSALKTNRVVSGRIPTVWRETSGKRMEKRPKDGRNFDLGKNPVSEKDIWIYVHLFKLF